MPSNCFHCDQSIMLTSVAFRETCDSCGSDMHVCRNCTFYDEGSHHECRESSAEYVKEKEKNNRCEYFRLTNEKRNTTDKKASLKALEDLFK